MKRSKIPKLHNLREPTAVAGQCWPEGVIPVVSIHCVTYNHINFIRDAIEGFLNQVTTFPVEILIHDDASTDGTSAVVNEYAERYPHIISACVQSENTYSKPDCLEIRARFFDRTRGKYVARCEGDDYWIAKDKLEKQVSFMERHPEASFCFHNALVLYGDGQRKQLFVQQDEDRWYSQADLVKRHFVPSASRLIRMEATKMPPVPRHITAADWINNFTAAGYGPFYYFSDVMSVYRVHDSGVWSRRTQQERAVDSVNVLKFLKSLPGHDLGAELDSSIAGFESSVDFLGDKYKCDLVGVVKEHRDRFAVYGAGGAGAQLIEYLLSVGLCPSRVYDVSWELIGSLHGLKVSDPEDVVRDEVTLVVIASFHLHQEMKGFIVQRRKDILIF